VRKVYYVNLRQKLTRPQFQKVLAELRTCIVAMDACGSAHHWGRVAQAAGHEVRLIPALYFKPFVKRHKNDARDAEAIAEAASRPSMRTVAVKDEEQQAQAMLSRTREMFVRQRTQLINAVRAHLAEYGIVLPQQRRNGRLFAERCRAEFGAAPEAVISMLEVYLRQIEAVDREVAELEVKIKKGALRNSDAQRLQTMPGIGPMSAMAIQAFCPPCPELQERSRLHGMARSGPATTLNRWQGSAWAHYEDGSARRAKAADYRRDVGHQRQRTQRPLRRSVACEYA